MGVRGLTTFIAKQSHKYLQNYELHDCYLVIDGNNLSSQLYKWHCTRNDCFGGDYDKYAKVIYNFFQLLAACNVTPLIVFDGGYEKKKIRTVYGRLRSRIRDIKRLNSVTQGSIPTFPLFMRDLFVGIILKLGLKTVRCDFEADYEIACLARCLNCPVLSYDSDFYVFDVLYIPFSTFELNKCKIKNTSPARFYIRCRLYRIENFTRSYGGLHKTHLPLMATLLGNDYITRANFHSFYSQIKLAKGKTMNTPQQRRIASVIKFLQDETFESAVRKILGRMKMARRKQVAGEIKKITDGYLCTESTLLEYLHVKEEIKVPKTKVNFDPENYIDDDEEFEEEAAEDSCSGASENSESSNEDLGLMLLESQALSEDTEIPARFTERFRQCYYPPSFMDILQGNTYFFIAQAEDYSNVYSHHISVNILAALNKIISSGSSEFIRFTMRTANAKVTTDKTPACNLEVPDLAALKDIHGESAKAILFKVLEIGEGAVTEFIGSLPESWQLYIVAVIYWIKNGKPHVAYCHVYALVLCSLVLNKIDERVGCYRCSVPFLLKFSKRIDELSKIKRDEKNIANADFKQLLNNITEDDCILCFKDVIDYFEIDVKMTRNPKLFDIAIVDCFAQFQSCLLHIKYLNMLLNNPLSDFLISEFYNGTFIYNMCTNFMKRTDIDAYLGVLLKNCPSLLNCIRKVIDMLVKTMSGSITTVSARKRRRKRKKNTDLNEEADEECKEEDVCEDEIFDANNRFSMLRFTKS